MKKLLPVLMVVFFMQNAIAAETDTLRNQRLPGIPSMNKIIEANKAVKKEQQKKLDTEASAKKIIVELTDLENDLIMRIHKQDPVVDNGKNVGYLCVKALTASVLQMIGSSKEESKNHYKDRWGKDLHPEKVDISNLVDKFFTRNEDQGRIAVKPSKSDGFQVGTENCGKGDRNCRGSSMVSIPVYDGETGLVLVYRSIVYGPLAASGWIFLYRYDRLSGRLTLIVKQNIWIS
ncbi:MAG: hypothetical protein V2B20_24600 [Pseudomonadota bacterium]